MNKILILILSCCLLSACYQEDVIESTVDSNGSQSRAASDLFKVTAIKLENHFWWDGNRGVDNEGNFYYLAYSNETGGEEIFKYNHQQNTVIPFSPFEVGSSSFGHFCFDDRNNFCYVINEDGNYALRRVSSDGNNISDQVLNLPPLDTRPGYEHEAYTNCGITAATNGNIFMIFSDFNGNTRYFRLSSQNGVVNELNIDFSDIQVHDMTQLYKANGALHYIMGSAPTGCHRINTNTGLIEPIELRFSIQWRSTAACTGKANLYALNGRQIVMVRPNAASDLIVGVIPDKFKNEEGKMVNIGNPVQLYMNSDASIFYVITDGHNENYTHEGDVLYKLTL